MRSVSIVYRKHRDDSTRMPHQAHTLVKRSVDEYYTKLVEKQKIIDLINHQKNDKLERIKLKTSKSQRNNDKYHILQTLSIAQISLRQQPEEKKEEIRNKERALIFRKLQGAKTVLKGLNIPNTFETFQEDEGLDKTVHNKLKNLFKSKASNQWKDTVIAISANFIINQHYFWSQEDIQDQCVRFWKYLQSHATLVWICEKEETFKKLIKFSKVNNLRLDAVYVVLRKKGRNKLTVSYQLIENDFGIRFHKSDSAIAGGRKLIAINGLLVEHTKDLGYQSFYLSVPIIRNYRSIVHYVRIEMLDRGRLGFVVKVLSQQMSAKPLNIIQLVQEYESKERREKVEQCSCRLGATRHGAVLKMQQIRSNMMKYFNQSLSLNLNDRIIYDQTENSIQFIIGDMIRRNYKIFQNYYEYFQQHGQWKHHRNIHQLAYNPKNQCVIRKYRNQAYLWE